MTRATELESRGNAVTPFTGCAHTTRGGMCAPRKRGEYVTSDFQFFGSCHSVPPSLSFSVLARVDCGGVDSLLSDLILEIIC